MVKFSIDTSGFDELEKTLKKMQKDADKLAHEVNGEHPIEEILSPSFMKKHTKFLSFKDMLDSSGFEISTEEDLDLAIQSDKFNQHIKGNSKFSNWNELYDAAGDYFIESKSKKYF